MQYNDFTAKCDAKVCLRKRKYHEKGCLLDSKRQDCYDKYEKVNNKKHIFTFDDEEQLLRESVWERDGNSKPQPKVGNTSWKLYCRFWKCLLQEEQSMFLWLNRTQLWVCKNIDVAHLKGKGANPELKYKIENCVLMNRLAHTRLDTYKDPITGFNIDVTTRDAWLDRIRLNIIGVSK